MKTPSKTFKPTLIAAALVAMGMSTAGMAQVSAPTLPSSPSASSSPSIPNLPSSPGIPDDSNDPGIPGGENKGQAGGTLKGLADNDASKSVERARNAADPDSGQDKLGDAAERGRNDLGVAVERARSDASKGADIRNESGGSKLSLNGATQEDMMNKVGLSDSDAEAVIQYQQDNGPITSKEDLKSVGGLSDTGAKMIESRVVFSGGAQGSSSGSASGSGSASVN